MRLRALLAILLFLAACTTPSQRFESKLHELSGSDARNCGLVVLHQATEQAIACASSSLASHQPFEVGFQLQGVDSEIWEGLTLNRSGVLQRVHLDSDPSGGSSLFAHSLLLVDACSSPTLAPPPQEPISCPAARVQ